MAAAGAPPFASPSTLGRGPGEDVLQHGPGVWGWGEGPHRGGGGRMGEARRCAFPLTRDAAAGGGDVARGGPAPTGARIWARPGREREECGSGRVGVCDTLPPTWRTWGPEDAGGRGTSFLWSLSLLPGHFAPALSLHHGSPGRSAPFSELLLPSPNQKDGPGCRGQFRCDQTNPSVGTSPAYPTPVSSCSHWGWTL